MSQIKILTIIGARPQIIKAAALSRAIQNNFSDKIKELIVHTGQHYDDNMSQVFIDELEIPRPNYHLNVGSGSHGKQTSMMIEGIEEIILKEKPACIILYGDTNTTLAGAVSGSKIQVPIIHIEAGLRSFNKLMPEEINRIVCDHVSTLLFSPSLTGYSNLLKEGFVENNNGPYSINNPKIFHCGDVMYDNSLYFSAIADKSTTVLKDYKLEKNNFILATIHRNNNTDEPERLNKLFKSLLAIAHQNKINVIIPLHPRTSKLLAKNLEPEVYMQVKTSGYIKIIAPVSYLEMITLEKNSKLVMTDSGGVQKEAFFFKKPCIILRAETEWLELLSCGAAILTDTDESKIAEAYNYFTGTQTISYPNYFGDGKAAQFICEQILQNIH